MGKVKKVIAVMLVELMLTMPLLAGSISVTPSPAMSVSSAGTAARNVALKYQINYYMSFFDFHEILNESSEGSDLSSLSYDMTSLQQGVKLSFLKEGADDIFYGNELRFLKGESTLKNTPDDGNRDGYNFEDETRVGILFNVKKTGRYIKVGPYSGFGFSTRSYTVAKSKGLIIGTIYVPLGIYGTMDLGKKWILNSSVDFDLILFGSMQYFSDDIIDIDHSLKGTKIIKMKFAIERELSERVGIQIEPMFTYRSFGCSAKSKQSSTTVSMKDGHAYEYGFIAGIKF
jgi:hypothetical protein